MNDFAMANAPNPRFWNAMAHLSALAGLLFPLGNLVGPLVVWQTQKRSRPLVAEQAKAALNFQITAGLVLLGFAAITAVLPFLKPLNSLAFILWIVFVFTYGILAAYRWPEAVKYPKLFAWIR